MTTRQLFSTGLLLIALSPATFGASDNIILYHPHPPDVTKATPPSIPRLSEPSPLAVLSGESVHFKWAPVENATAYSLQVSEDPIFFKLLVNEALFKETSYTLGKSKLQSGKNYYWRVASIKEDNKAGSIKSLYNRSSFTLQ